MGRCAEGVGMLVEKGRGKEERGLRWSAIPPIEITVKAWRATDIE